MSLYPRLLFCALSWWLISQIGVTVQGIFLSITDVLR